MTVDIIAAYVILSLNIDKRCYQKNPDMTYKSGIVLGEKWI